MKHAYAGGAVPLSACIAPAIAAARSPVIATLNNAPSGAQL